MPLQVAALPIKLPNASRFYERRFSDGDLVRFAITLPHWPYLEYLNAVAADPKIQINFFSQMQRWTSTCNEGAHNVLNFLFL